MYSLQSKPEPEAKKVCLLDWILSYHKNKKHSAQKNNRQPKCFQETVIKYLYYTICYRKELKIKIRKNWYQIYRRKHGKRDIRELSVLNMIIFFGNRNHCYLQNQNKIKKRIQNKIKKNIKSKDHMNQKKCYSGIQEKQKHQKILVRDFVNIEKSKFRKKSTKKNRKCTYYRPHKYNTETTKNFSN